MEIKIRKELKETEYKIYVSTDGEEFYSEHACMQHERNLHREELAEKLKNIEENVDVRDWTPLDGCEYTEYHDYKWFKPKNIEEVNVLNEYFDIHYRPINETMIGQWVCLEITDDEVYVTSLESSLRHIPAFLEKFGYKVTIKREV